jgi:hypothetical protein
MSKYKYTLSQDYEYNYDFSKLLNGTKALSTDWGEITKNRIVVREGYAWDGCSGNVWQGKTIDRAYWMPKVVKNESRYTDTLASSLLHDYSYQFLFSTKEQTELSLYRVRKFADVLFYETLIKSEFKFPKTYYHGVRIFGVSTYLKRLIKK